MTSNNSYIKLGDAFMNNYKINNQVVEVKRVFTNTGKELIDILLELYSEKQIQRNDVNANTTNTTSSDILPSK